MPEPTRVRKASNVVEFVSGQATDLPKRALREETLRKFKYHVSGREEAANYYSSSGALVAQKIRTPDKDFYVLGDLKAAGLFGEQLWESGGKRLVITEGEIDAMSYAQATGMTWPVVSVPNGAAGASKAIKKSLEFVESFDEVVFMFDSDKPGKEAALECAALLRPGLAKIVELPLKDASDMLVAGRGKELRDSVWQAKTYRPDGIIEGKDIDMSELLKPVQPGFEIPYPGLQQKLRGLRKRELVMICAGSGIGKSTLARELGSHLVCEHKQRVGWIMLEESWRKTAQALAGIRFNQPVGDIMENPNVLSEAEWATAQEEIYNRCAFYDAWGSTAVDNLISKMRYLAVGCDADFIVLDHISMVVSGLDVDERKTLDILMTRLRQFCEQTGVGVIGISHLRRNTSKESFNDGASVSLTDLRGSAAIEQLSDVVISAERDQQAEEGSNVAQLRVLKNRPYGFVGTAGHCQYVNTTGRLLPYEMQFTDQAAPSPALNDKEITF